MELFITGTDTGVGKTYVTTAIARHLTSRGRRVLAWKPLETGCIDGVQGRLGADAEILARAAGDWQQGKSRGYHLLRDPLAPKVAAENEGIEIELAPMLSYLKGARIGCADVLVEGAGGWRVPINRDHDIAAFALQLGFPVVLVGRSALGTINHTVLTAQAILSDGATLAAIILSQHHESDETSQRNRNEISQRLGCPVGVVSDTNELPIVELVNRTIQK